eukprot:GILJ01010092.1.p1 GENE.GILJ01010092.1~~GILJ01010092.1.p1  ORF type:complete len:152 (-),score=30.76 GILJ01010092.1:310-765(-)
MADWQQQATNFVQRGAETGINEGKGRFVAQQASNVLPQPAGQFLNSNLDRNIGGQTVAGHIGSQVPGDSVFTGLAGSGMMGATGAGSGLTGQPGVQQNVGGTSSMGRMAEQAFGVPTGQPQAPGMGMQAGQQQQAGGGAFQQAESAAKRFF